MNWVKPNALISPSVDSTASPFLAVFGFTVRARPDHLLGLSLIEQSKLL